MNAALAGAAVVILVSLCGAVFAFRRGEPKFRRAFVPPAPPLDCANPLVIRLSAELRALEAMPIGSKIERKQWYEHARSIQKKLRSEYAPIYDSLPHELEHYLVDADIRAKEPGYAQQQKSKLGDLLSA
jgi:hypothetical protein